MSQIVRIGTRASPLALCQAETVKALLLEHHVDLKVEIVPITTEGDRRLDVAVSKFGGKGIFLKELEVALINGDVDLCVHSMKDVPVLPVDGLAITATLKRDDERDGFISRKYRSLDQLPKGAIVGTSSTRRKALLLEGQSDLDIRTLRGNIHTRLKKLEAGEYDAIILAVAGLERMDMLDQLTHPISPKDFTPAVTQGIVGIETKIDDERINRLVKALNSDESRVFAEAERAVSEGLGGDCHLPLAAWARLDNARLVLDAGVFQTDGSLSIRTTVKDDGVEPRELGLIAARQLMELGAQPILDRARQEALQS